MKHEEISMLMKDVVRALQRTNVTRSDFGEVQQQLCSHLQLACDCLSGQVAQVLSDCEVTVNSFLSSILTSAKSICETQDLRSCWISIERLYLGMYLLWSEFNLNLRNEMSHNLGGFLDFAWTPGAFTEETEKLIRYHERRLLASVVKRALNSEAIGKAAEAASSLGEIDATIKTWERDLDVREQRVKQLMEKISESEAVANFVALYKGFAALGERKAIELQTGVVAQICLREPVGLRYEPVAQ